MSQSVENAQKFLETLRRHDLSKLISRSEIIFNDQNRYGFVIEVAARMPWCDALSALPDYDRKRIAQAIVSDDPKTSAPDNIEIVPIIGDTDVDDTLLPELIIHRSMMIDVSTGRGVSIQDVNDYYIARQIRLKELTNLLGAPYQNEHEDLWAWFRHWKANFDSWAERRQYLTALFQPSIDFASRHRTKAIEERPLTGWERVDRALSTAKSQLSTAQAEEDFQAIGLLCREVMISLAQAVYDPALHVSLDGVSPSPNDANRMLEAYVHAEFPGESYKEVRAHARAALALSLNLQHRRTATRQLAALCVEAATSITSVISIISGRAQ